MKLTIVALLGLVLTGCTTMMPYQSLGVWTADVRELGPVSYCQGGGCGKSEEGSQWTLGDNAPKPTEGNIHAALIAKAVRKYHVAEVSLVLKEVNVAYYTELDGTVRGWNATAIAGEKPH